MEDCYELAKIAYSEADYYHTELWMAQALKQLEEGEESTLDKVTVLDYLSYAIYQQGEIQRALEYTKKLLELGKASHSMKSVVEKGYSYSQSKNLPTMMCPFFKLAFNF